MREEWGGGGGGGWTYTRRQKQSKTESREESDNSCTITNRGSQLSVSASAQDGIVLLRKAHTRSASSLGRLCKVVHETVPMFVRLNTDRSRSRRVECRPLLLSTPASFRKSIERQKLADKCETSRRMGSETERVGLLVA